MNRAVTSIPAYFLYGEPPAAPDEQTVHIETIAARSTLHDWRIGAHRHRELHQIFVIFRGSIDLQLDDRRRSVTAPCVLIVPAGIVHGFEFERDTQGLVISFIGRLAYQLAAPGGGRIRCLEQARAVEVSPAAFNATDIKRLGGLLLREFSRSAPGRDMAMHGLLSALLANVLRLAEQPETANAGPAARDREIVAHFRESIESRYRHGVALADYARELGVTGSRLRRACLAVAGECPLALIHRRRLIEAERQLRYTTMSIAQIGYYLGFEDPAYFSRFFTRRRRMSPRAFRQRDLVR